MMLIEKIIRSLFVGIILYDLPCITIFDGIAVLSVLILFVIDVYKDLK